MTATPLAKPAERPNAPTDDEPLLTVDGLKTYFPVRRGLFRTTVGHIKAVDGVSFDIRPGETLGLVGESGCGKSTVGKTLLRLVPHTAGRVKFDGVDVFAASRARMKLLRRQMQIVFQDPYGSLNPRMTVSQIIQEPMIVHKLAGKSERRDRVADLLTRVGLGPDYASRYPHEFSGGQRQRIGIARALALEPRLIICDEPVSALDVSIQSQILNLLADLQQQFNLAYLFIAHNLSVIKHFCDRVAVMYLGRIVELTTRDSIYRYPRHPYTQALLSAAPTPDPTHKQKRIILHGEVPSPMNPPPGCPFHPRCQTARAQAAPPTPDTHTTEVTFNGKPARIMRKCVREVPTLDPHDHDPHHQVACFYPAETPDL